VDRGGLFHGVQVHVPPVREAVGGGEAGRLGGCRFWMFLVVAPVLVSGFFTVGFLPALLSQRGEWEEVPLVP
jgi:hypothetical protein